MLEDAYPEIPWEKIKVISFDLDDTLWDNSGVVEKANKKLFEFLSQQEPLIGKHYSVEALEAINQSFIDLENPNYDNMTVLRKAVIKKVLEDIGGDLSLVNPAFSIFYHWRNKISIDSTIVKWLSDLKARYKIFAVSNGNSNLSILNLRSCFQEHYIAGIHGRAKPSPEMLKKISFDYQVQSNQIVHIGDSQETDVMSAKNAQCYFIQLTIHQIRLL